MAEQLAENLNSKAARAQGLYDPKFEHDACGVGFVAHLKGKKSHSIVSSALQVLNNLEHRGASGCEENTGDGAGILMQMPDAFLRKVLNKLNVTLPKEGRYGVAMLFMPPGEKDRKVCEIKFTEIVVEEGQNILAWRVIPTDNSGLGETARASEPKMWQVFIGLNDEVESGISTERKLFVIRKRAENEIRYSGMQGGEFFYVSSFSSKTLIYKGMFLAPQVEAYFPDLVDTDMVSALALVHSRFSTNTFPSWERAHPYRYMAHNGEINTLRGNINWMHARQAMLASEIFGDDLKKILPVIQPDGSDSAMFDNALEFLTLAGRPLHHAVMMMIPEPWSKHESMSAERKAFYEYHSAIMEPWDGPASIVFTDGDCLGAVLDRNGLRPSRYYVTKDDLVVMASEVGVLEIDPANIVHKGRLQPGKMFLIDTLKGRIIADEEVKQELIAEHPYKEWLEKNRVRLDDLPDATVPEPDHSTVLLRQQAFGYTFEDLRILMAPMARNGMEALGSMGTDTPLAVLSNRPHLLYNYFKQLFAQVTNPPIDAIREEIVTGTETWLGPERNLLHPEPESCRQIQLQSPCLSNEDLAKLKASEHPEFHSAQIPILFDVKGGGRALEASMDELFRAADRAISKGANILILTDRGINSDKAAIPALLAVAGLHHHLIRVGTRTKVGMVIETGEPREVHHFCLLLGFGASAINPYLAFESLDDMIHEGFLKDIAHKTAVKNYIKAVNKGVIKVLSKMGISTIQSYRGAQIFEAVGLNQNLIDKYFTWTPSRIEGVGLDIIAQEVGMRHGRAFDAAGADIYTLEAGGEYQWRKEGENHLFNPLTVHKLQAAVRTGNYRVFKEYSQLIDDQARNLCTLRGLLDFKMEHNQSIPIEDVESVESIVKRFKSGAMSYGSISKEAHENLAIAMNRLGGKSNTGEGGEDEDRYTPDANGDSRRSAIKQVASGRFGVTSHYLVNSDEIQIKMAQGAKPGEGGQLPGSKVYPWIAKTRHSTPGVGLISPPPHHDIYSIEDLAELIHDLKNANERARISVKLVSEVGVGTIAAGVAKGHADVVLISGFDGGTGASPLTSLKHAGLPWELGLAETHQTLVLNNLRSRIVVEADGQLKTGRDVIVAALLGAEEFGFATAPLVASGCIMMRVCHLNTCPVGVATQDPELRKNFTGKPEHVVNFMTYIAQEVRELMAQLGFRTINEMVGRSDRLEMKKAIDHWKASGLDYSRILWQPEVSADVGRYCNMAQDHGLDKSLDKTVLLELCKPALDRGEKVSANVSIRNVNRVTGTIVGSELTRKYGAQGLPDDTIHLNFKGSAGQSFSAFVPRGMTMELEGDANDYVGKGLSGGRIFIYPAREASFVAEENVIIGNVALYGATAGEVYIRGQAGERFCVRNSGVKTVVEGVGDHACEYMTGGVVVILGATGRNFAAGMSGGVAYVLDEKGVFPSLCNTEMVGLEAIETEEDISELHSLIENHMRNTGSGPAERVLAHWKELLPKFIKVMPKDYKRVLESLARVRLAGKSGDEATMAAFEENARDMARAMGN